MTKEKSVKNSRLLYIDFFRGLALINMVIYHLLYDLRYVFNFAWANFFTTTKFYTYQQYICISFIFIAGISTNFSGKTLKHASVLIVLNKIIEIVTYLVSEDLAIKFGVLGLIGWGILFVTVIKKLKINPKAGFLISLFTFVYLKYSFKYEDAFYKVLYGIFSKYKFGYVFGFPRSDFYSSDYFPIFPWIFLIFSGYFFGKILLLQRKTSGKKQSGGNPPENDLIYFICKIGQKSLIIYLLHQPAIYIVLLIITSIFV